MDFCHFFSSSKDFTFDFSMSHCYTRYRSEEISPNIPSFDTFSAQQAYYALVLNTLTGLNSRNTSLSKNNSFFWNLTDFLLLFVVVASLGRFCVLDFVSFCDVFVS